MSRYESILSLNKVIRSCEGFNRGRQDGVTLIELLISITLIAIMAAILGSALRLGYGTIEKGEKKMESNAKFMASLSIIDSQLQSQMPVVPYLSEDEDAAPFEGERDGLKMVTSFSVWGRQRGQVVVAYKVEAAENGKKEIVLTEDAGSDAYDADVRSIKLFEGRDDIFFEYFSADQTTGEGLWKDSWDEAGVPEKVKVTLIGGKEKLEYIIPLRVNPTYGKKYAGL